MKFKVGKENFLVYLFFFLISFLKGLGLNANNNIYIALYISLLLFATSKFIRTKISRKEILILLAFISVGIIDLLLGGETTVLFTAIALIFMKKVNLRKVILAMFYGRTLGLMLMICLPLLGIIENNVFHFYRNGEFIDRFALGYRHPNLLQSTFSLCSIMFLYLYYNKTNIIPLMIIEFINIVLYRITYSRTGFIILSIVILIFYFVNKNEKIKKILLNNLNVIFVVICLIPICSGILYGKVDLLTKIDQIVTGRISYISLLMNKYSMPLFKTRNYANIAFDNGIIDMIYNGGLVATIMFVTMQIKTNNYIKKYNLYKEGILVFICLIFTLTESFYMSFNMNISLLFFSFAIYKNEKNNNIEKDVDRRKE